MMNLSMDLIELRIPQVTRSGSIIAHNKILMSQKYFNSIVSVLAHKLKIQGKIAIE